MKNKKSILSICLVFMLVFSMIFIPSEAIEANADLSGVQWVAVNTASAEKAPVVTTTQVQPGQYNLNVSFSGFYSEAIQEAGETFSMVSIPDCISKAQPGDPAVPIKTVMIEIPNYVNPTVSLGTVTNTSVTGSYNIYPQQPYPSDEIGVPEPGFVKNAATYASTNLFPSSVLYDYSVMNFRNHRVLAIDIAPLQVIPSTEQVTFSENVNINISYGTTPPASAYSDSVPVASKSYDDMMGNGLIKLEGNYPAPLSDSTGSTDLEKYMILLDDQYINNDKLDELIDWKEKKGYDVEVVKTSDINANGEPTNTEIVNYMRGLPGSDYPIYLLIIGDHTKDNGVEGTYFKSYQYGYGGYTDLDISCRDSADLIPDLFCGRIPAYNNAELTTMLTKVLSMEKEPPTGSNAGNMYDAILVAGQIQDSDYDNVADRIFCETADGVATYFEQNPGGYTYDVTRAIVNPDNVTADCLWQQSYPILWKGATGNAAKIGSRVFDTFVSVPEARTRITNTVNDGVAIVQHRDHGGHTLWGDPYYTSTDVDALTNGVKTPLVFSINCLTGGYHVSNSFVRSWMKNDNNGAYSVIGAVDVSFSGPNDWLTHGLYMAFLPDYRSFHNNSTNPNWSGDLPAPSMTGLSEGNANRLGQMLNFAKTYMYANTNSAVTMELFQLFGDPEAAVQLHSPYIQSVSCSDTLSVGASTFTVSTGEKNSMVSLYGDSQDGNFIDIQMCGITDASGEVTLDVSPYTGTTGDFYVTVTKPGAMPFQKTVSIGNFTSIFTENFESDMNGWQTYVDSSATAEFYVMPEGTNNHALVSYIGNMGTDTWHVHARKAGIPIHSGNTYKVSFTARTETGYTRDIAALIEENGNDYTVYGSNQFTIDDTLKTYEFTFTSSNTDLDSVICFEMGKFTGTTPLDVVIDDVVILGEGSDDYPAWDPNTVYTSGMRVSYDGYDWEAKWWNYNSVPGGSEGVWRRL